MVRKNSRWERRRELREGATHHQHGKVGEVIASADRLAAPRRCCTTVAVPAPGTACARERESVW